MSSSDMAVVLGEVFSSVEGGLVCVLVYMYGAEGGWTERRRASGHLGSVDSFKSEPLRLFGARNPVVLRCRAPPLAPTRAAARQ